jgi:hypothetical protein
MTPQAFTGAATLATGRSARNSCMAASYSPSAAMVRTARNEIARVERAAAVIAQRRDALLAQVASLDQEADGYERRLQLLRELVEVEGATPTAEVGAGGPVRAARAVRGRELRREAARLLWSWKRDEAIHYREWFERVLAAGYAIGGKDPAASFLTNVRDSPAVLGGEGQGLYRLDPGSVEAVEREVGETEAELADVEQVLARAYEEEGDGERLRRERERVKQRLRRLRADREELAYVFAQEESPAKGSDAAAARAVDGAALRAA